ncbi:phage tail sheath C-terminal domain-containing protein [uncultured Ruegeria sp.]|uniref:phage tail sheath family protein n=1 Tax=uncultured Ruegeria sp. TaxID=259304 RepID=UPI0026254FA2|nr:phage tail sheath C-terminal domain-containing protein [uncultured Ruegeria sp.]
MMATQYQTPGVYIKEIDAFGNAVVEVPTAIPAFIGYTQKANSGNTDLTNLPTRIESMVDYKALFGGGPDLLVTQDKNDKSKMVAASPFLMFQSLKLFYANGGGPCYIVSVGPFSDSKDQPTTQTSADLLAGLNALELQPEPTMIVCPEAVMLSGGSTDWEKIATASLAQCNKLQSRVSILDIVNGDKPRGAVEKDDPISNFRTDVGSNFLDYGAAYYPFLNTSVIDSTQVTFANLDKKTVLGDLMKSVEAEQQALADAQAGPNQKGKIPPATAQLIKDVQGKVAAADVKAKNQALMAVSAVYKDGMDQALAALNLLPPSPAIAGVIAQTDNTVGVWKAPANTSVNSVVSPSVNISHDDQADLNAPLDGKAVNAIRTMPGRGIMVWGARTLDANSLDWRYVNVRRTLIMLEQSIKIACEAYVFSPNDASTWVTVSSMIENFLTNQWKAGALAGSSATEAFDVQVGLGSTMTGQDILNGYMRVEIRVAVVRPAEFIVLTFEQKMQTS